MLNKKIIYIFAGLLILAIPAVLTEENIITYECYFEKMGKIEGVKDSGKDLIICNYPSIDGQYQGMYHSYYHENDMIQALVVEQGASYTYTGKNK